ncbi:MAG: heavy-metal-associated domain-containing protein [Betaproteobacteria bacterium]|nr:heavy-metal-associated domain-containing protein [Betaproteobacteria bacterium]
MLRFLQYEVAGPEKLQCAGCESRVAYALKRLAGVSAVHASAETQSIAVCFEDAQVDSLQIEARLGELGYRVRRAGLQNGQRSCPGTYAPARSKGA